MKMSSTIIALILIILIDSSIFTIHEKEDNCDFSSNLYEDAESILSEGSIEGGQYNGPIWPMYQFDQQRTGLSPFNATGNPGRVKRVLSSVPIVHYWMLMDEEQNIYCIDWNLNLTCYLPNFTVKWSLGNYEISDPRKVLYNNGVLYAVSRSDFSAIDCSDGSILWKDSSHVNNEFCFFDRDKTMISCIHSNFTTSYISSYHLNGTLFGTVKIGFPEEAHSLGCPSFSSNGKIYIPYTYWEGVNQHNKFYAIDLNGTLRWLSIDYIGHLELMIDENDIIYAISDQSDHFEAFYPNGTVKWKKNFGAYGPPSLSKDGNIIVASNKIYSIYPNGTVKWEKEYYMDSRTLTVDSDGNILFCGRIPNNNNGYLIMLNKDGKLLWKYPLNHHNDNYPPIVMPNGELYIADWVPSEEKVFLHILGKTKPESPKINPARSGDSYVNFTWFAPDHNGGEEIDEYRIYRKESLGGQFLHFQTLPPETRWFQDETVINGNTYYYRIIAVSSIGESDPSEMVYATPLSIPSSPRNLEARFGDNYVYLSWDPSEDDGGTDILKYTLYKGPDAESMEVLSDLTPSRRNYNDTDVEPGNIYHYVLTATNSEGESGSSNFLFGSPKTLPEIPSDFSLKSGNGFVHLFWSPPLFDGGSPLINYTLFKGLFSEGMLSPLKTFDMDVIEYNDTEVTNGERYIYTLTVSTDIGISKTNELTGAPVGPPSSPVGLVSKGNDSFIEITWNEPENNGGLEVSGYYLERKSGSDVLLIPIIGKSYVYRDNDVINGISYSYRIRSFNSAGNSSFTKYIEATPLGKPSQPDQLSYQVGRYFSLISWQGPDDDGGSPITSYRIYRNGSLLNEVPGSTTSYNDTGVSPGITYSYSIGAVNSVGESILSSSMVVAVPDIPEVISTIPTAPNDLAHTTEGLSVTLSWSEPESDGNSSIIEYLIYRRSDGAEDMIGSIHSTTFSFTDEPLMAGNTYEYRVSARNGVGEGPYSNMVKVTINIQDESGPEENDLNILWFIMIPIIIVVIVLAIGLSVLIWKRRGQDGESEIDEINENQGDSYDFSDL